MQSCEDKFNVLNTYDMKSCMKYTDISYHLKIKKKER